METVRHAQIVTTTSKISALELIQGNKDFHVNVQREK